MKLYADSPARRTAQATGDLLVLLWVAVWAWLGRQLHDTVLRLQAPADSLTAAGLSVHDAFTGAGAQAARIPGVGDGLKAWFDRAAVSGIRLQEGGRSLADTVSTTATWLGWLTALVPILIVAGTWVLVRWRFVRRATAAQTFIDSGHDLDLFALRAMTCLPMPALARISPDPAGAWRRRDPEVIRALATAELRRQGLRPPR